MFLKTRKSKKELNRMKDRTEEELRKKREKIKIIQKDMKEREEK